MADGQTLAREEAILGALDEHGRVEVNELASRFGVSAVTIRKDLDALERRSLLRRVRGGAVVAAPVDEGSFADRLRRNAVAKKAIARMAAGMVADGDVIAVDSSTTGYFLMLELLAKRDLIVITNSLRGATLLSEESNATVLVPGGIVRRASNSTSGPIGDVLTGRGRVRLGFFGVAGLSPRNGLMEISSSEAESKRAMAEACDGVYGILDASKEGAFGLHPFSPPTTITAILTSTGVTDRFIDEWSAIGVDVRVAGGPVRALEPIEGAFA